MSKFQVFATPDAPAAFTLLDMAAANFMADKAALLTQGFEVIGEPILAPDARAATHAHQLNLADPSRPYGGPGRIGLFHYMLLHAPRLFGKKTHPGAD
ncbi:hypothetical protein [Aeromonas tecta]|uniref:hypothetical protein n=1 Tax=Aeromonas tecta TaxID=324617 RepID=UPI0006814A6E|nr:hypothetical protein [Aeromonas tecta]